MKRRKKKVKGGKKICHANLNQKKTRVGYINLRQSPEQRLLPEIKSDIT